MLVRGLLLSEQSGMLRFHLHSIRAEQDALLLDFLPFLLLFIGYCLTLWCKGRKILSLRQIFIDYFFKKILPL
nr:MAG TPA: hypothetical protein [Caudoviricetes sp.]